MPKFIITVIFALFIVGLSVCYILFKIPPNSEIIVVGFLFLLLVFFSLAFSLPISYILGHKKEKTLPKENLKEIYRLSIRRSFFLAFIIVVSIGLSYLKLFRLWNIGALLILAIIIDSYLTLK